MNEDSLAFRNIMAVKEHAESTRQILRELEETVGMLNVTVQQLQSELNAVRSMAGQALAMRGHGATA